MLNDAHAVTESAGFNSLATQHMCQPVIANLVLYIPFGLPPPFCGVFKILL